MAKKEEFSEDFRYLVRIQNTDLDGKKSVASGLTGLKGVNNRLSRVVADAAGLDRRQRLGDLSDEDIDKLVKAVEEIGDSIPSWMRNRRLDPDSGDDLHLIGTEIDMTVREDLNRLKKIRSWRGMRHEKNLPVRGQRTKSNGRTGITVGVQRKKK